MIGVISYFLTDCVKELHSLSNRISIVCGVIANKVDDDGGIAVDVSCGMKVVMMFSYFGGCHAWRLLNVDILPGLLNTILCLYEHIFLDSYSQ